MKKITGKKQKEHYETICKDTGEIINLVPEYNDMSREPGLGKQWYDENYKDIYKRGEAYVIQKAHKTKPPRYYDKQYKKQNPDHLARIKLARIKTAIQHKENYRPERLKAAEKILDRRTQSLTQKL